MSGGRGAVLTRNGQPMLTLSLAYDDERVSEIFIVRNPDKLAHLDPIDIE